MRTNTDTVTIDADPASVFEFLADPENLPRWAKGFASEVRSSASGWIVTSPDGSEIQTDVVTDPALGIVDWHMRFGALDLVAHSRVTPHGYGSHYAFTQHQVPGLPDEVFARQVDELREELSVLRDLLSD